MAVTLQQVIDRARQSLNDDDKVRYTDAQAAVDGNDGLLAMLNLRPDIFFGQLATFNTDSAIALATALPIDTRYTLMLQDYIIHRAEYKNDESANDGRSVSALQFFQARLTQ
jgi:hypothetical protein